MGSSQNRKGKVWEREVVRELKGYGFHALRTAALQAATGSEAPDVRARKSEVALRVECKAGKRVPWVRALEQASVSSGDGTPVVLARLDNQGRFAFLSLSDFVGLAAGLANEEERHRKGWTLMRELLLHDSVTVPDDLRQRCEEWCET